MNELTNRLIEENKKTKAPFLDLGSCGLTELPKELLALEWLEGLNLGYTYFDETKWKYAQSANEGESNNLAGADMSLLTGLPSLRKLFLSHCDIPDFGFLAKLSRLQALDLSYNAAEWKQIAVLRGLTWLNLRWCRIDAGSIVMSLPELEFLDLSYAGLPNYKLLTRLPKLRHLFLHSLPVREIGFLPALSNLEFVDLHRTEVTDFTPLASLKNLKRLDISENKIKSYAFLSAMPALKGLDISENEVHDYRFLEKHASRLTYLNLNETHGKDYSFLSSFPNLEELSLLSNGIKEISFLSGLLFLQRLNIRNNSIADIRPLKNIHQLQTLDAGYNEIADLRALEDLRELNSLSLDSNRIAKVGDLLPLKALLPKPGFYLTISSNPFVKEAELSLDSLRNHTETIRNLLMRHQEVRKQKITLPVKVLLLGNHASGKSSLLHYIKNKKLTDNSTSTHIIRIEKYPARTGFPEAIFYDFGGQDYYHGIYRVFLTAGAIQIIVWNEASNQNQTRPSDSNEVATVDYNLDYWLGQKRYAEKNDTEKQRQKNPEEAAAEAGSLLIVQSYADKDRWAPGTTDRQSLTSHYYLTLRLESEKMEPSRYRRIEFEAARKHFLATLFYHLQSAKREKEQPQWYIDFLHFILKEHKGKLAYKPATLETVRRYYKADDGLSLEDDLEQLHKKGLVLYYRDALPDCVWLNPEAFVHYVHAKVLSKERLLKDKGRIPKKELEVKCDEHIVKLLAFQKVIFLAGDEYIVPNYLPLAKTDADFSLVTYGIQTTGFVLRFGSFIPFGLLNQIICFYGPLAEIKRFWRDQLLFSFGENKKLVLIRFDFEQLEIRVQSTTELAADEKQYLFYSIMAMYWDLPVLFFGDFKSVMSITGSVAEKTAGTPADMARRLFEEEAFIPDDQYISANGDDFISNFDLFTLESTATKITAYPVIDKKLKLERGREIALFPFQPFTRKLLRKTKNVFISYSHDDRNYRLQAQHFFVNLEREKLISIWQDGLLNPGEEWDEKITTNLAGADIIVLLMSQNFINSSYVHEVEMSLAVKRADEKNAVIIPVLLKDCDWKEWRPLPAGERKLASKTPKAMIGKYQFLPISAEDSRLKPLSEWANPEKAWMQLVNAIRKLVV